MNYALSSATSVMTPQARLTLRFWAAVLVIEPFGFIIGPMMSRVLRRRA